MSLLPRAVARVCVDSPLPHLDRAFDYAIPDGMAVKVGSRVRVVFAGRLTSGVVVEVADDSDFGGELAPVKSASAVPSYTAGAISLAREVARRYGGSLWDVLRLMAPPRVAAVEKRYAAADAERGAPARADAAERRAQDGGESIATASPEGPADRYRTPLPGADPTVLEAASTPGARLVWEALPDPTAGYPVATLLAPALAVAAQGRSAIVVLPDARALAAATAALTGAGLTRWKAGRGDFAVVHADDGATARFDNYLAGMRGDVRLVLGTRPAALQPVPDLGLIAVWDEGNGVYEEMHAPYPHARTVAAMRAGAGDAPAGLLLGSFAPSVDAMALVAHGWARRIGASRAQVRAATPHVDVLTDDRREAEGPGGFHWMPGSAWRRARKALGRGPVAILVPRAGYVNATACARCGEWAACPVCEGPLSRPRASAPLRCDECAADRPDWHCPECHGYETRQLRQGVERIAEQVRAMAGAAPVAVSAGATGVLDDGAVSEGFVVATPSALPATPGGYAALVIVGADAPASGGLGAELHALRLWLTAAALVRPRGDGGEVIAVGELPPSVREAMVAWDAGSAGEAAYAERADLGLPPARRSIRLEGTPEVVARALDLPIGGAQGGRASSLRDHPEVDVLDAPDGARLLTSRGAAQSVVDALRALQRQLSQTREGELRMRVDAPFDLR
ncbi:hypothetical protein [Demequina pelophila]|uniref:primosomal protein N' family DNA-binding protein n=1 Tax=Demequina pelophila TaxID=1638984 RepID=UPI000783BF4C|nr:hypothetical protein [Demequina pelophila]